MAGRSAAQRAMLAKRAASPLRFSRAQGIAYVRCDVDDVPPAHRLAGSLRLSDSAILPNRQRCRGDPKNQKRKRMSAAFSSPSRWLDQNTVAGIRNRMSLPECGALPKILLCVGRHDDPVPR